MARVSLTEFLLDRINEREQAIRALTVWPEHIVMREIAFGSMLRYLLTTHHPEESVLDGIPGPCVRCRDEHVWPCATVRAIATVYAGHPDFDPAWALSARH